MAKFLLLQVTPPSYSFSSHPFTLFTLQSRKFNEPFENALKLDGRFLRFPSPSTVVIHHVMSGWFLRNLTPIKSWIWIQKFRSIKALKIIFNAENFIQICALRIMENFLWRLWFHWLQNDDWLIVQMRKYIVTCMDDWIVNTCKFCQSNYQRKN
jgi:hypothetical protein